jgi:hypothetical protein
MVGGAPAADAVRVVMEQAIADEYRAETIYQGVIGDFGAMAPFTNVLTAEQENIALYDRFFALDLPPDVRRVFENNRAASLNNPLPAFQRCAA